MESDYGGYYNIMGNGQTISGLKVASKVFIIISGAELGKPHAFLIGRNSVRSDDDAGGRGDGKKQKATCNELYRGYALA
ncbi:Uncharacterised protein [uncultured archaeon]|nr:Uncharacterised protein [uncultured archaeon]